MFPKSVAQTLSLWCSNPLFPGFPKNSCYLGDAKPHHLWTTPAKSSEGAKADVPQALATVQRGFVSVALQRLKQLLWLPRDTRSQLWSCNLSPALQKQLLGLIILGKKNNVRWHQKVFHRVLVNGKERAGFQKRGKDVCREQGGVTRVVPQPEHWQDLSTTLAKVNVAVLEGTGLSHLGEGKFYRLSYGSVLCWIFKPYLGRAFHTLNFHFGASWK